VTLTSGEVASGRIPLAPRSAPLTEENAGQVSAAGETASANSGDTEMLVPILVVIMLIVIASVGIALGQERVRRLFQR